MSSIFIYSLKIVRLSTGCCWHLAQSTAVSSVWMLQATVCTLCSLEPRKATNTPTTVPLSQSSQPNTVAGKQSSHDWHITTSLITCSAFVEPVMSLHLRHLPDCTLHTFMTHQLCVAEARSVYCLPQQYKLRQCEGRSVCENSNHWCRTFV